MQELLGQLNAKLVVMKHKQLAAASELSSQSMSLEEHSQLLEGMAPRIATIDFKMDSSLVHSQKLHDEEIAAFEAGLRQQSMAISESRSVLDLHTGHNKKGLEIARKHREEMELFKAQLDELRLLRKADEQRAAESVARRQVLEEQHHAEIESFSLELKQQRVLREREFAKQAQLNKAQHAELMEAHHSEVEQLRAAMEQQQRRRGVEEQELLDEQRRREALAEEHRQDLLLLQQEKEQLAMSKAAQDKEREIALRRSKVQGQRMKDVEAEIVRLKQAKHGQTESVQRETVQRIERLQAELARMSAEKERTARAQRENEEIRELKAMEHDDKERTLKREMSQMMRTQNENLERKMSVDRRAEKGRMEHDIAMQRMENSMIRLAVNAMNDSDDDDDDDHVDLAVIEELMEDAEDDTKQDRDSENGARTEMAASTEFTFSANSGSLTLSEEEEENESENEEDATSEFTAEEAKLAEFTVRSKTHHGLSKENAIELRVQQHRGHRSGPNHPRNLLDDEGDHSGYQSRDGEPAADWIIFKMMVKPPLKLTRVQIKNGRTNMAVKKMTVSMGYGDAKGPWLKLIQLDRLSLDKEHDFRFKNMGKAVLLSDALLKKKAYTHCKVEIAKNHGSKQSNAFFAIKLFGRAFLD